MIDSEDDARPIDYAAHRAGYINRHGEDDELLGEELLDDYDDEDAYPYGDTG